MDGTLESGILLNRTAVTPVRETAAIPKGATASRNAQAEIELPFTARRITWASVELLSPDDQPLEIRCPTLHADVQLVAALLCQQQ
jgi:hypothetical protein